MVKLPITNEFATAVLSNDIDDKDIDSLKADAREFLISELNLPIPEDTELAVVENNDSSCHIALPYYSAIESTDAAVIDEADIAGISGGEVFAIVISIVTSSLIWGTVGYAADLGLNPDKYNDDGTLKK